MNGLALVLPADYRKAVLVGRLELPAGPTPVIVQEGIVYDVSGFAPTVSDLLEHPDVPLFASRRPEDRQADGSAVPGVSLGAVADLDTTDFPLLAPVDLQCIKAAGVTFAASMTERVLEEHARGDAALVADLRERIQQHIGSALSHIEPGSPQAADLRDALIAEGLWSQYLEVAIGPDAELFTKAPVLSAVGHGAKIGVRSDSGWNNPEPEIVLVCNSRGGIVGATLGNDVNLRDFEGRSALLLGKAKDNNASCALGPFIRLFGRGFTLDDVARAEVTLGIEGEDGFTLEGSSSMTQISRRPQELVRQAFDQHDYPDGLVLFLGTGFAPIADREEDGRGFTHKPGDRVVISSPLLGRLENTVTSCSDAPPWRFGVRALMRNLAARGLLASA